jgi:hypothetical protein
MTRVPVESSTLAWVSYLPEQGILEVEFCSREIYRYLGVPPQIYSELLAADSKGRYFNASIRNCFPWQKVGRSSSARTAP